MENLESSFSEAILPVTYCLVVLSLKLAMVVAHVPCELETAPFLIRRFYWSYFILQSLFFVVVVVCCYITNHHITSDLNNINFLSFL